tara:strand:- start:666 stop:809 length:144 start_codon:yes stop_codon:yes gene_type:complete
VEKQSPIALPPSLSNVDAFDDFKRVVYFYTEISLFCHGQRLADAPLD